MHRTSHPWAHIDLWLRRPGAISFPEDGQLEVDWRNFGFFKVTFEYEVPEGHSASIEPGMVPALIQAATAAFEGVNATGADGARIREYFMTIDPHAYEYGENDGAADMVLFRDHGTLCLLCGDFGNEMCPEDSHICQLSTDCFGTYDMNNCGWIETDEFTEAHVGAWASPCILPQ